MAKAGFGASLSQPASDLTSPPLLTNCCKRLSRRCGGSRDAGRALRIGRRGPSQRRIRKCLPDRVVSARPKRNASTHQPRQEGLQAAVTLAGPGAVCRCHAARSFRTAGWECGRINMWLEVQMGRRDIVAYIGCARALYDGGATRVKVKLAR